MKALTTLILMAFITMSSIAQEKNIITKSVSLDNLITFIVENYALQTEGSEFDFQNINFLIQVPETSLSIEGKVVLKHAFKLLSKRLTSDDLLSIITYSGFNGVALNQAEPQDLKRILHTIDNFKSSVKELHPDGIELAYNFVEENFDEDAVNTIIMVRNTNILAQNYNATLLTVQPQQKAKNSAVLLTAIALLPELIAIIKN